MLVRSFHFKLLIFHSTPHLLYFLAFNAQGIFQFSVAQSVVHKYFSCLKPGSKSGQKEIPKTCNMINFCARYSLGKQERQITLKESFLLAFGWFSCFVQYLLAWSFYPSRVMKMRMSISA